MRKTICLLLLTAALCGVTSPASYGQEKMPLRIGFWIDDKYLGENYSKKDVTVATEMIFGQLLSEGSFNATFRWFDKSSAFVAAIEAGELDYVEMKPLLWLGMSPEVQRKVELLSIVQMSEARLEKFVLLAAPGATFDSLKGKDIRIHENNDRGIGRLWLEHELREENFDVERLDDHFGKIEKFSSQENVLLPTFFGKADACLVRIEDFEVISELNPQVSKRLQPVAISPGVPFILVGATGPNRDQVVAELGGEKPNKFVDHTRGRQAFSLLGVNSITDFKTGDLDALSSIFESAEKGRGKSTEREQGATLTSKLGAGPE